MRTTKTVSISIPFTELEVAGRLAKSTNRSLSDTFWQEVDAYAKPKAEALGIVESDVNRLIEEYAERSVPKSLAKPNYIPSHHETTKVVTPRQFLDLLLPTA